MSAYSVDITRIIIRLAMATVVAGIIGSNREHNSHPAGMRTHILVCLGACVIAMIQQEIAAQAINFAIHNKEIFSVIRADPARLICQVVSGIGFLGAGTIIVTRHNISGLTTAASLWAVAGLGIAIGMGYYTIAVISAIFVIVVLAFLKRAFRITPPIRRLEVKYVNKSETQKFVKGYFNEHKVNVLATAFSTERTNGEAVYKNIYRIEIPRKANYVDLIDDISANDNIRTVRVVTR